MWFLYIVKSARGDLYTGITLDLDRRLRQHSDGTGAKSLRGKAPLELMFSARVGDHSRALKLENAVKKLRRMDKVRLVAGKLKLEQLEA